MLVPFLRIAVAVVLCFVVSREVSDSCSGILPSDDAVPKLSPLFLVLAGFPEPVPQVALLWRTTSASCCVLSLALSIVQPHIAMLFFGWMKGYHVHHLVFYIFGVVRCVIGLIIPWLMQRERRVIINMLTAIIDFLGKFKRPLTEEQKRAKEESRKYVYARPPTCRCPPEQCTCEPIKIRVKRVNSVRGTLKWFRRWLEENQQDPVIDVPSIGTVIQAREDIEQDTTATESNAEGPTEESKKNL